MSSNILKAIGLTSILLLTACSATDEADKGNDKEKVEQTTKQENTKSLINKSETVKDVFKHTAQELGKQNEDAYVFEDEWNNHLIKPTNEGTIEELTQNYNYLKTVTMVNHDVFHIFMSNIGFSDAIVFEFLENNDILWATELITSYKTVPMLGENPVGEVDKGNADKEQMKMFAEFLLQVYDVKDELIPEMVELMVQQ